jgi:hypothetical protein
MTAADRLGALLACVFLCAGLVAVKSLGWLEMSWWLVAAAPVIVFAHEAVTFLPAAIAGTFQHHFRRP